MCLITRGLQLPLHHTQKNCKVARLIYLVIYRAKHGCWQQGSPKVCGQLPSHGSLRYPITEKTMPQLRVPPLFEQKVDCRLKGIAMSGSAVKSCTGASCRFTARWAIKWWRIPHWHCNTVKICVLFFNLFAEKRSFFKTWVTTNVFYRKLSSWNIKTPHYIFLPTLGYLKHIFWLVS